MAAHDVFLNFRGEETRKNFTGFLHKALKREAIDVFIDSEDLWGGEEIKPALLQAIRRSKISILVFSKGYADSKWCLLELVEIIRCHRSRGQKVLPIFLQDVKPRDVRHQTGSFKKSFQKHKKNSNADKIQSWKDALTEVGGKTGFELQQVNGDQSKLVELVVEWALSELNSNRLGDVKNPIGLDAHVEHLLSLLNVGSNGVRFVGICGIGGIGKTTIAIAIYNNIVQRFKMTCFLANVRDEASRSNGLVSLQEKLIHSVSKKKVEIRDVHMGQRLIKERLQGEKVLLVLDDVNSYSQLKFLAFESNWFGSGSRIIITSRDEQILKVAKVEKIYWPEQLDYEQSLQLFSLHAFSRDQPPEDYKKLSQEVLQLTGGLPLTLEVLGSSLFGTRDKKIWQSKLRKLKRHPDDEVFKILKISYDDLEAEEKSIFLDAACFFIGWKKETVISLWEGCGFDPISAINKLTQRSLLKFTNWGSMSDSHDELMMHDQIQAMGCGIVFEESPMEPSMRSRLWSCDEILKVLKEHKRTQMLEGILPISHSAVSHPFFFSSLCLLKEDFAMMSKLRFLNIDGATSGVFPHLPSSLTLFSWRRCPLEVLPDNFYHNKLVQMDLSGSQIRKAWTTKPQNESQRFQKLKVLHLEYCYHLSEAPDFSWFPYLETLKLRCCKNIVRLHESIGDLKYLVELSLDGTKIEELPNSICRLSSLERLSLYWCKSLNRLPESFGDLNSLVELSLDGTKIEELPDSICRLSFLERLSLGGCESLKRLPESIGDLKSLIEITLYGTKIEELPNSICRLSSLKRLSLGGCESLKRLPGSIGDLKSLVEISLYGTQIFELPRLTWHSWFGTPIKVILNLIWRSESNKLLKPLEPLEPLEHLEPLEPKCLALQSSISGLPQLQTLVLQGCTGLQSLPELPSTLTSLDVEDCISLLKLPHLSSLKNLRMLKLSNCNKLKDIQGLEGAESLEEFSISSCNTITDTPRKIHGQGKLTVDRSWRSVSLKVNDGIKELILCLVFAFEKKVEEVNVQEGELVNLQLHLEAKIHRKHGWTTCDIDLEIKGIEYTTERDIIYVHHFKQLDWFGLPLETEGAIEITHAMTLWIREPYGHRDWINCEVKFWKLLLLESKESEQQMPNQESSAKMVSDFFSWSCEDAGRRPWPFKHELLKWAFNFFNPLFSYFYFPRIIYPPSDAEEVWMISSLSSSEDDESSYHDCESSYDDGEGSRFACKEVEISNKITDQFSYSNIGAEESGPVSEQEERMSNEMIDFHYVPELRYSHSSTDEGC